MASSFLVRKRHSRRGWLFRLAFPDRLRGGRTERVFNYFKMVMDDYRRALGDVADYTRQKPLKAAFMMVSASAGLYAHLRNPDLRSFDDVCLCAGHDLTLVHESHRNPQSEGHHLNIIKAKNSEVLRLTDFYFFSVIWRADYASSFAHFKARCEYLEPGYLAPFDKDRIIDIGFLGRWWLTEKAMKDYDVNPEEWDDLGRPVDPVGQLRHMW